MNLIAKSISPFNYCPNLLVYPKTPKLRPMGRSDVVLHNDILTHIQYRISIHFLVRGSSIGKKKILLRCFAFASSVSCVDYKYISISEYIVMLYPCHISSRTINSVSGTNFFHIYVYLYNFIAKSMVVLAKLILYTTPCLTG